MRCRNILISQIKTSLKCVSHVTQFSSLWGWILKSDLGLIIPRRHCWLDSINTSLASGHTSCEFLMKKSRWSSLQPLLLLPRLPPRYLQSEPQARHYHVSVPSTVPDLRLGAVNVEWMNENLIKQSWSWCYYSGPFKLLTLKTVHLTSASY